MLNRFDAMLTSPGNGVCFQLFASNYELSVFVIVTLNVDATQRNEDSQPSKVSSASEIFDVKLELYA